MWADMYNDADFQRAIAVASNRVNKKLPFWTFEADLIDSVPAQDIISALSRGNVRVPAKHSRSYWNEDGGANVSPEVFANLMTIHALQDEDTVYQIKTAFPELESAFTERIGSL